MGTILRIMTVLFFGISYSYSGKSSAEQFSAAADTCLKPITELKQDVSNQLSLDDQRSLMVYKAWKATFASKSEASQKGIDLGVVYEALQLSGSGNEKDQKYFQNKEELSQNYFEANSSIKFSTLVTNVNSVEAIKAVTPSVSTCFAALAASQDDRHSCTVNGMRNSVDISLEARYLRPRPELRISSAQATFIKPSGATRHIDFERRGTKISPSKTITLKRDPDEAVSFAVNSNYGMFQCDHVKAIPAYTISGNITGLDRVTATYNDEVKLPTIPLTCEFNRKSKLFKRVAQACTTNGVIKAVTLSPNTTINPEEKIPKNCGVPSIISSNFGGGSSCAQVDYSVVSCRGPNLPTLQNMKAEKPSKACVWQARNGAPVTASLVAERVNEIALPTMPFRNEELLNEKRIIKYAHAASVKGNVNLKYEVTVTDTRAVPSKTIMLSSDLPTSEGFSSALDQVQMTLVIWKDQ